MSGEKWGSSGISTTGPQRNAGFRDRFGRQYVWPRMRRGTDRVDRNRALDLGINHFDCADSYGGGGVSERFLGAALHGRRHEAIVATKTGYPLGDGPNNSGLSRARIIACCEASLKRLGTDYVDIFYLHRPDPLTEIDESLGALDDLIRQGKVRYAACSNYSGWEIARLVERGNSQGRAAPIVSQSRFNLLSRDTAHDITPAVLNYGMGIVPFSPLAGGLLTGKYVRDSQLPLARAARRVSAYTIAPARYPECG